MEVIGGGPQRLCNVRGKALLLVKKFQATLSGFRLAEERSVRP